MEPTLPTRFIQARNRRQAREWGLALISQGIESALFHDPETNTWALEVPADRCGDALKVLKQYHVENKGWGFRQDFPRAQLSFNWACLGWVLLMVFIHHLSGVTGSRLDEAGMMNKALVEQGQWWRIFTAMTLHGDLSHLFSNLATGTLFLGLVMGRHGAGVGILGGWIAGALANLAALFVYTDPYRSLGASGMIMAMLGMLSVTGAREAFTHQPGWKAMFGSLSAGFMLFVLTGSNPASDLVVHLGGFLSGLLVGTGLEGIFRWSGARPWLQPMATTLFLVSLIATWMLALAV